MPRQIQAKEQEAQIEHYLATGQCDEIAYAWPGNTIVEAMQNQQKALRTALVAAVRSRIDVASLTLHDWRLAPDHESYGE